MPCAPTAARGFSPLDEHLGLLAGTAFSPRVIEGIVRLGVWLPFAQAAELLAFFLGVRVDADTVRRLTEAAGAAQVTVETAAVERLEAELPPAPAGPAVQQVSADGAMVPLVGGEWAEAKTVAIGTVETPADGEPHTDDLSYFSRLADAETFGRLSTVETHRRGTETAGTVVAVLDGAEWLQGFIDLHRPDAVRILDFPHAVEHLSVAAQAVFGAGTEAASAWLAQQRHTLRHGDPDQVLVALCQVPVAQARCPVEAAATQEAVVSYLTKRREQLAYANFVAQGYPIGSGCVESANKLVVEGRLKGSGMHWARDHVNPMLALRAVVCSGRWDECWPVLWCRWRTTAQQARRPRPRRQVVATAGEPPVPSARPKLVIHGRPTQDHPWKRTYQLRQAQARAKT